MIIDSHAHIFNKKVISNVSNNNDLVSILNLQTESADKRISIKALITELRDSGIDACLILPTAGVKDVKITNDTHIEMAEASKHLYTACTLHPFYENNLNELMKMQDKGIRGIKLCSFSQGFAMDCPETRDLFNLINKRNKYDHGHFFIVLDTFYLANQYFGNPSSFNTTPEKLSHLIHEYSGIKFVAAHMGGLSAPFNQICQYLLPSDNLYLDTSNAAHTLSENEFIHLLKLHGAEHILFGTDWPWFGYKQEIKLINRLLELADYDQKDKKLVFGGNIASLLGINHNF